MKVIFLVVASCWTTVHLSNAFSPLPLYHPSRQLSVAKGFSDRTPWFALPATRDVDDDDANRFSLQRAASGFLCALVLTASSLFHNPDLAMASESRLIGEIQGSGLIFKASAFLQRGREASPISPPIYSLRTLSISNLSMIPR